MAKFVLAVVMNTAVAHSASPQVVYRIETIFNYNESSGLNKGCGGLADGNRPSSIVVDANGGLFVAEQTRICSLTASGIRSTVAGSTGLLGPKGLALENGIDLLISDAPTSTINRLSGSILSRVAGIGTPGYTGEGFLASETPLSGPTGLIVRPKGGYYVSDTANHRIRKVGEDGQIITVVGIGLPGYNGDHLGTETQVDSPAGLAIDSVGNLYFADAGNNSARVLRTDGRVVTLYAGSLKSPQGIAVSSHGDVFISDTGNHRIVVLSTDGTAAVVAGTGAPGFSGDGNLAVYAQLFTPLGLFFDSSSDTVLVADSQNGRIRRLTPDVNVLNRVSMFVSTGSDVGFVVLPPDQAINNVTGPSELSRSGTEGVSHSDSASSLPQPGPVSVAPDSGSGSSQTFTAVYSDLAGAGFLKRRLFLMHSALLGAGGCFVQADSSGVYLVNDQGSGLLGPVAAGSAISNGQCTLNGTGTTVINAGTNSTVTLSLAFNPAFSGSKNIYMFADDSAGSYSGWQLRGSYAVTQSTFVPTAVSVASDSGSGSSQTFTAVYSDLAGAGFLKRRLFLMHSALLGAGGCFVQADSSGVYLVNDQGSGLLGPVAAGSAISNGQCTLNGTGTTVINAGTNSTVTLSLAFNPAFSGSKNIYMFADDSAGSYSGWQLRGSYAVTQSTFVPTAVSVASDSGSGSSQTFTAVYSDLAGAGFLKRRLFLMHSALLGAGGCFVQADSSGVYLVNDQGSGLLGPVAAGSAISNGQCTLNGTGTTVINAGTNSTVTLSLAFNPAFSGSKNIYMFADDSAGSYSGWQLRGSYAVTQSTFVPTAVSVASDSGSGSSQTFTAVYSDLAGAGFLKRRLFLMHSALLGAGGCFVQADSSGVYLVNDQGSGLLGPVAAGSAISNGQCTLNGTGTTVINAGTNSTVTLSLAFNPAFSGSKNIYMFADDSAGSYSGWQLRGSYAVTQSTAPKDFVLTALSPNVKISPGGSSALTISVSSTSGYLGSVTPAITSLLPAGVTASSCSPATIQISGSCVITLTANSSLAVGNQTNLIISGTDGSTTHTATVSLTVATFSISASPATILLSTGGSSALTISVSSTSGYLGSVTPAITSLLPAGVTASSCSPATIQISGSCVITLTANSSLAVGNQTNLLISGTDGSTTHTATVSLTVATFSISASPATILLSAGGSSALTISVSSTSGYLGSVTPAITSLLPAGVTASSCSPATIQISGSCVITLTANSSLAVGNQTNLIISGTDGSTTHTATVSLTVATFSISASPATILLSTGGPSALTISVSSTSGYLGSVTPAITSLLPAGVTASSCSPATIQISGSCVITLTAKSNLVTNINTTVTVSAADGKATKIASVLLSTLLAQESSTGVGAAISVTISSLPATGTSINLSAATKDWRLFTQPTTPCQSYSECYGDRRLNGDGIMGVHTLGQEPNFQFFSSSAPALSFSFTDGTIARSGNGRNYMYYGGQSYAVRAIADNSVLKTLTMYWGIVNAYKGTATKSADGTATFTFALSDGSVAAKTQTVTTTAADQTGLLKIVVSYRAGKDGQELIVTGTRNGASLDGNAGLTPIAMILDSSATGPITRNIPMDADLQAEANDMFRDGDTQLFPQGFVGSNLVVPSGKSINMRVAGQAVPDGLRIGPTETRAIIQDTTGQAAIMIGPGTHNVSIDGFEVTSVAGGSFVTNYSLVSISVPQTSTSPLLSSLPTNINLGHLYVHCNPVTLSGTVANRTSNCRNGLDLNGNQVNLHDSVVKDITWENIEANAVRIAIGQSVTVQNNELMSNGEVILVYSAGGYVGDTTALRSGLFANNFLITRNWIHKDLVWLHTGYEKNLIEVKNGRNGEISYNVLEDSFLGPSTDGQYGYGITIANRTAGTASRSPEDFNQPTTTFASTQNIDIHHNIMHRVGMAFSVQGPYDSYYGFYCTSHTEDCTITQLEAQNIPASHGVSRGTNWNIHDNYVDGINPRYATYPGTADGYSYHGGCLQGPGGDNFTFQRNTCIFDLDGLTGTKLPAGAYAGFPYNSHVVGNGEMTGWDQQSAVNNYQTGMLIDSNIFGWDFHGTCVDHLRVLIGGGGGSGCAGVSDSAFAQKTFTNNLILNANVINWQNDLNAAQAVAPLQYRGNRINTTPVLGQGAPALTHEAEVKSGKR